MRFRVWVWRATAGGGMELAEIAAVATLADLLAPLGLAMNGSAAKVYVVDTTAVVMVVFR